jgi:dTMP kinase
MQKKPLFIAFEGLDGSGLSTQAGTLRNYLLDKGANVVLTKEETDGLIGGLIKSCLKKEWKTDPLTVQMLFVADRNHHLKSVIEPALREGKFVITDRYVLSTLAFGGISLKMEFLKILNSKFRAPDHTFVIDVPPEVCLDRIRRGRFSVELFEEGEKLRGIRANYHELKDFFPNTHFIDGNRDRMETFEEIRKILDV